MPNNTMHETCYWFKKVNNNVGICTCHPPTPIANHSYAPYNAMYPIVRINGPSCGDYRVDPPGL